MRAIHRKLGSLVVGVLTLGVGSCLPLRAALDDTAPSGPVPMPSLRGVVLGNGVAALRALGVENVTTVPVDGHLFVVDHDNWVVVRQAPKAGVTVAPDEEVTLSVRKTEEAESRFCFDNDC
ncbi:PASTA domain-containing protein [Saccharomonospora azurea]|uniref:PASTA domain-containing protein n=1 Tax=Saccharomonospora azurea NA-128 TaxID=882081 RepID=H8GEH6_9PSEU|nr:PASTA domain-containing protein [Saccharomonospora azurea]EHY87971.1 PASTA domain-containing protein [Saccharomonospora azurea NA-128]